MHIIDCYSVYRVGRIYGISQDHVDAVLLARKTVKFNIEIYSHCSYGHLLTVGISEDNMSFREIPVCHFDPDREITISTKKIEIYNAGKCVEWDTVYIEASQIKFTDSEENPDE